MEHDYNTIDEYISIFPNVIQNRLSELRQLIHSVAPDAEEKISYRMPAFAQNGILVYFAAHKNHIGFYPTSSGIRKFKEELSGFEFSKGAVKFPYDQPLPMDLVRRIVAFRLSENLSKGSKKK